MRSPTTLMTWHREATNFKRGIRFQNSNGEDAGEDGFRDEALEHPEEQHSRSALARVLVGVRVRCRIATTNYSYEYEYMPLVLLVLLFVLASMIYLVFPLA